MAAPSPAMTLRREIPAGASSANRLALDIGFPSGRITDIDGRRSITADTAVRLGRTFGNGAQFRSSKQHDIAVMKRKAVQANRARP